MRTKPTVIRRMNYELVKKGRRICEACGAKKKLDAAHFYQFSDVRYFHYLCIECEKPIMAERERQRYAANPDYRRRKIEAAIAYRKGTRQRRLIGTLTKAQLKEQARRAAFERILAGIERNVS